MKDERMKAYYEELLRQERAARAAAEARAEAAEKLLSEAAMLMDAVESDWSWEIGNYGERLAEMVSRIEKALRDGGKEKP